MPLSPVDRAPFILVIDDDEDVRDILTTVLADEGYEVVCATDPRHALGLIADRRPDLILLDLLMSGEGGVGFVESYRQGTNATAPILLVSGMPNVAQQAASIGVHGSISKPFDLDALVETVQTTLGRR
jgi:two-component system nitrogen regulation response regulator NtrX